MPELLSLTTLTALAVYLIPCVASALGALVAWQGFRRLGEDVLRQVALAFGIVAAIQALLLAARQQLPARKPASLNLPAGLAIQALWSAGFQHQNTLIWMEYRL